MIGASSVCAVVAGMSVINEEFRAQIASVIVGDPGGQLSALAFRAQGLSRELIRSALEYRADNGPMVAFGLVAVVLAFLMFKT